VKFVYEYRTSDNVRHDGVVSAADRDAAFAALRAQGIRPGRLAEAPGLWNRFLGKGKRWSAIVVLLVVVGGLVWALSARREADAVFEDMTRRQVIGDLAVIEKGVATGWADVFPDEGERFLASFAIPAVKAGLRNTTEGEIREALSRKVAERDGDSIEARQIKAMVEGMKQELREYLAAGGTVVGYGARLVERQESELAMYNRAKVEMETLAKSGADHAALVEAWEEKNAALRKMGARLLPFPGGENF